jgi:hypothetical protein
MARPCTICNHPRRSEIDKALVESRPIREIMTRFAVQDDALLRHKKKHLFTDLARTAVDGELESIPARDWNIAEVLRERLDDAKRLGLIAEKDRNIAAALDAIRTWVQVFKLQGQLMGDIAPDNVTNIQINNTVIVEGLCRDILEVLRPFPDARKALADYMLTRQQP